VTKETLTKELGNLLKTGIPKAQAGP
jgi:hypothetical protein